MKLVSKLSDQRINSINYLIELTIKEYIEIAQKILDLNEFQRKRVRSSKTIYALLQEDLLQGCVIPPIVLALTQVETQEVPDENEEFTKFINDNSNAIVILDGLQRTHTMLDLTTSLKSRGDTEQLENLHNQILRVEIYIGINRLGILYRMLTLNTGQTPMSLRQQIEMLYLDYAKIPVDNITLLRESDGRSANAINEYNFRDMVEGFNSYLERNELPLGRTELLENIRGLEKLARENASKDIFREYLVAWHGFIEKINQLAGDGPISQDFINEFGTPFGRTVNQVFKKAQAISGFGAAVGKLKDFEIIDGFDAIKSTVARLEFVEESEEYLPQINKRLDWIKNNANKIGNAQRMYFLYYFRELFNPESDAFSDPYMAIDSAFQKYRSQNH